MDAGRTAGAEVGRDRRPRIAELAADDARDEPGRRGWARARQRRRPAVAGRVRSESSSGVSRWRAGRRSARCPVAGARSRASTAPVTELRRKSSTLLAPDSSRALTTRAVRQRHLGAGGDVEPGLDHAVVAEAMPMPALAPSRQRSPILTRSVPPPDRVPMIEAPPPMSEPSPTTTPCDDAALDHRGAERAGVEVAEALVHDGGAGGEVGAEADPVGVGDAHARSARRSRSSAGTCRRRRPATGRRPRRRSRVALEAVDRRRGRRWSRRRWQHAEDAVEVDRVGLHQAVREQVQAQVGVGGVGRAARRGRLDDARPPCARGTPAVPTASAPRRDGQRRPGATVARDSCRARPAPSVVGGSGTRCRAPCRVCGRRWPVPTPHAAAVASLIGEASRSRRRRPSPRSAGDYPARTMLALVLDLSGRRRRSPRPSATSSRSARTRRRSPTRSRRRCARCRT